MLSDLERLHIQLYGRWIAQTRIPREMFVVERARAMLKAWELTMQADAEVRKLLADRLGPYPERNRQANG
jgi:hypothetical protein